MNVEVRSFVNIPYSEVCSSLVQTNCTLLAIKDELNEQPSGSTNAVIFMEQNSIGTVITRSRRF